jgi:hypothetical protein
MITRIYLSNKLQIKVKRIQGIHDQEVIIIWMRKAEAEAKVCRIKWNLIFQVKKTMKNNSNNKDKERQMFVNQILRTVSMMS